jgi:hypothetical protein
MKHLIPLTMLAFALVLGACGGDKPEQTPDGQEMKQDTLATTFYCPMKCEGEKTYDEMGSCPVCGMDLVESGEDHSHDGHDHDHDHEHDDGHEH